MGFCDGFGWGSSMGWGGLGILGPILWLMFFAGFLVLVALGGVWLVRQLGLRPAVHRDRMDPLETARRRLAAGEVSLAEFEQIRSHLQS